MVPSARVMAAVVVLLTTGLAGCAGVDEDPVTTVAQRFYAAVRDGDGASACALLASSTRSELEESAGKPCASAVLEEDVPDAREPTGSAVFGTMAQVRYAAETAFLTRVDATWRVLAVACGDRPPGREQPFDCQVKGG